MTPTEIKSLRKRLGLTQAQFAERIGIKSWVTVSKYERGERVPSPAVQMLIEQLEKDSR